MYREDTPHKQRLLLRKGRFELALKALAPEMEIIAPWREWDIKSREEEIEYAEAHNIPLKINRETNYSKDKNVWHLSHEGLDLEDPANEPQYTPRLFIPTRRFSTMSRRPIPFLTHLLIRLRKQLQVM